MSHSDYHWHATNECFNCFNCKVPLLGQPFLPRKGYVYCSIQCSRNHTDDPKEHANVSDGIKIEDKQRSDTLDENSDSINMNWKFNTSSFELSKLNSLSIR